MNLQTILVPTDFSPHAEHALTYAAELAARFGARLLLLHVQTTTDVVPAHVEGMEGVTEAYFRLIANQEHQARQHLDATLARLRQRNLEGDAELRSGAPWQAILDAAQEHHADLIVMGTHGRGPLARLLLGSVAERVVRAAACPVLTTRLPEAE